MTAPEVLVGFFKKIASEGKILLLDDRIKRASTCGKQS